MTDALCLVASFEAKEDFAEFFKKEMIKLIAPTRAEEGCLQYDLHQNNKNPASFVLYGNAF